MSEVAAVTVVPGAIGSPEDSGALEVKLSIWETEVTLRANGTELGNWPTQAVTIRPLDASAFEFTAEGDRLIFTPEDPDLLRSHPLLKGGTSGRHRRQRSRRPRAGNRPSTAPVVPASQQRAEPIRTAQSTAPPVAGATANPVPEKRKERRRDTGTTADKPNRRERRIAADAAREAALAAEAAEMQVQRTIEPDETDVASPDKTAVAPKLPKVPRPPRFRMRLSARKGPEPAADAGKSSARAGGKAAAVPPPEARTREPRRRERAPRTGPSRMENLREKRHEAWIGALDLARKYDFLGLDRVPVDVSQRGGEHQHTWDHRVAATGGAGKYICTICGAFRINI